MTRVSFCLVVLLSLSPSLWLVQVESSSQQIQSNDDSGNGNGNGIGNGQRGTTTTTTTIPERNLSLVEDGEGDPVSSISSISISISTKNSISTRNSIAGYVPQANVIDESRIDLDQEDLLQSLSAHSFSDAYQLYAQGGHSFPIATLQLDSPLPRGMVARSVVVESSPITGTDTSNPLGDMRASLLEDAPAGATTISVVYPIPTTTTTPVCQVGGNLVPVLGGCFPATGIVTIGGVVAVSYQYDPLVDNTNRRSLQGIARSREIFLDCAACPLTTHQRYVNYYGTLDYADNLIVAVLEGDDTTSSTTPTTTATSLDRGHIDATGLTLEARSELVRRWTVYLSVWIAVAGRLEYAVAQCSVKEQDLTTVSYWDQAVAYYTGSKEGSDGSGHGHLLYHLADQLCGSFGTCLLDDNDNDNDNNSGDTNKSQVNAQIFDYFTSGQLKLTQGDCLGAKQDAKKIISWMTVPLIQGTLLFALMSNKDTRDDAAGYAFVAALVPLVYDCDKVDASVVQETLRLPATDAAFHATALPRIRESLQRNYNCLGVTCEGVGGLPGAILCGGPGFLVTPSPVSTPGDTTMEETEGDESSAAGVHIGTILSLLLLSLFLSEVTAAITVLQM